MNTHFIFNRYSALCKARIYILAFLWGIGLVVGIFLATTYPRDSVSVFRVALSKSPSAFAVFLTTGVPIAAFVLALAYRRFALCYPLCFLEAVCYGFCGMLAFFEFGSGAWAVRLLLLFSGSCAAVLIWWLLLRHSEQRQFHFTKDIWLVSAVASGVCVIDIFAVSPFLVSLSKYF